MEVRPDDLVVDVGAGLGAVTQELAARAGEVVAVEADPGNAARLRQLAASRPNVHVVQRDYLEWHHPRQPFLLFSNVPFNITSDVLRKLASDESLPVTAHLIVQYEVAGALRGRTRGSGAESLKSLLVKPWFTVTILGQISRWQFKPAPAVDASYLKLTRRPEPLVPPSHRLLYRDFVCHAFTHSGQSVLDRVRPLFTSRQRAALADPYGAHGVTQLNLEQWLHLFEVFSRHVPLETQRTVVGAEERLFRQARVAKSGERASRRRARPASRQPGD
jgi:23S rRNA (adenine-N6)-dimethyltransferase